MEKEKLIAYIPKNLLKKLKQLAETNKRTISGQTEVLLARALSEEFI